MKKDERIKFAKKALAVLNWCNENIEEYHRPSTAKIFDLIEELEEIEEVK